MHKVMQEQLLTHCQFLKLQMQIVVRPAFPNTVWYSMIEMNRNPHIGKMRIEYPNHTGMHDVVYSTPHSASWPKKWL